MIEKNKHVVSGNISKEKDEPSRMSIEDEEQDKYDDLKNRHPTSCLH